MAKRFRYIGDPSSCLRWRPYAEKLFKKLHKGRTKVVRPDVDTYIYLDPRADYIEIGSKKPRVFEQVRYLYIDSIPREYLGAYSILYITIFCGISGKGWTVGFPLFYYIDDSTVVYPYGYPVCGRFDVSDPDRIVLVTSEEKIVYDYGESRPPWTDTVTWSISGASYSVLYLYFYEFRLKFDKNTYSLSPPKLIKYDVLPKLIYTWSENGIFLKSHRAGVADPFFIDFIWDRKEYSYSFEDVYVEGEDIKLLYHKRISLSEGRDARWHPWVDKNPYDKKEAFWDYIVFGDIEFCYKSKWLLLHDCVLSNWGATWAESEWLAFAKSYHVSGSVDYSAKKILNKDSFVASATPIAYDIKPVRCGTQGGWILDRDEESLSGEIMYDVSDFYVSGKSYIAIYKTGSLFFDRVYDPPQEAYDFEIRYGKGSVFPIGNEGVAQALGSHSPFMSIIRKPSEYSFICGFRYNISFSYARMEFDWEVFDRISLASDMDTSLLSYFPNMLLGFRLPRGAKKGMFRCIVFDDSLDFGFGAMSWSNPIIWDGCPTVPFVLLSEDDKKLTVKKHIDPKKESNGYPWFSPDFVLSKAIIFPPPLEGFYIYSHDKGDISSAYCLMDVGVLHGSEAHKYWNDIELDKNLKLEV